MVINDFQRHCGRWVEMEEETQLRNHLKLARIRLEGDNSRISKEVKILNVRIFFTLQLWTNFPTRFTIEEYGESVSLTSNPRGFIKRLIEGLMRLPTFYRGRRKSKGYGPPSNLILKSNGGQLLFLSSSDGGPKHNKSQIHPRPMENWKKSKSPKVCSCEKDVDGGKGLRGLFKNWEIEI